MSRLPVVKGTLDLLVLRALSWTPMHGFEIVSWLERAGQGSLELEDSALAIFEDPEEKAEAHRDVRDVGNGDECKTAGPQRAAHETQERRRIAQVFEHIGEHDCVDRRGQTPDRLQIRDYGLIEPAALVQDPPEAVEVGLVIRLLLHDTADEGFRPHQVLALLGPGVA